MTSFFGRILVVGGRGIFWWAVATHFPTPFCGETLKLVGFWGTEGAGLLFDEFDALMCVGFVETETKPLSPSRRPPSLFCDFNDLKGLLELDEAGDSVFLK